MRSGTHLPLARAGSFQVANSPSLTVLPTAEGLLVCATDGLRLVAHDLSVTHWHIPLNGKNNSLIRRDECVWYGVVNGEVVVCRLEDGTVRERHVAPAGRLECVAGDVALIEGGEGLTAVHRQRGTLWRRDWALRGAKVTWEDSFLVAEDEGGLLVCLDAESGAERWALRFADPAAMLTAAPFDSGPREAFGLAKVRELAPVGDAILVITGAADVLLIDPVTGAVMSRQTPPVHGARHVSPAGVQFINPREFSVWDWRTASEVERQSYEAEVVELFAQHPWPPSAHGGAASAQAIVFAVASPSSALMAVERHVAPGQRRRTWREAVDGLIPIGAHPMVWGDYIYWATYPLPRSKEPAVLLAYRWDERVSARTEPGPPQPPPLLEPRERVAERREPLTGAAEGLVGDAGEPRVVDQQPGGRPSARSRRLRRKKIVLSAEQIARWELKPADHALVTEVVTAYDRAHGANTLVTLEQLEQRFGASRWMRFLFRALAKRRSPEGPVVPLSPEALEGAVCLLASCETEGVTDGIRVHLFYDMLSPALPPADVESVLLMVQTAPDPHTISRGLYKFGLMAHPAMKMPLPEEPID